MSWKSWVSSQYFFISRDTTCNLAKNFICHVFESEDPDEVGVEVIYHIRMLTKNFRFTLSFFNSHRKWECQTKHIAEN